MFNRFFEEWKHRGGKGFCITLLKKILFPITQMVYWISHFLPVKNDLIVFRTEIDFWDNGWAFYHYLRDSRKKDYVWLVENPDQYTYEKKAKFVSYGSIGIHFKACYYLARAHFVIITHGLGDLVLTKKQNQTVINLSHGCGYKNAKGVSRSKRANYDYAIVVSSFFIKSQSLFLQCDEKKLLPLGYPRNDILINNIGPGSENPFIQGAKYRKLILWMPTYRTSVRYKLSETLCDSETGLPLFTTEKLLLELNSFLKELNVAILLKIHHLQRSKDVFKKAFSNIIIITDESLVKSGLQLYHVVGKTDALLTDYSSISTDYLMLDKPIAFILDDIEDYIKDRGFAFDDVKSVMPGTHIYDIPQLYSFVEDIVREIDRTKELRSCLREEMLDYLDDKSSARIADFFKM